jgi:hypothetical protein
MVTIFSLRMQDHRSTLRALLNELRSTQNAEELLLKHMREVTTFWTKTVAVDALSFTGHKHPFGFQGAKTRENACEVRESESEGRR